MLRKSKENLHSEVPLGTKDVDFFAPQKIFPSIWIFGIGLTQFRLSRWENIWSLKMWIYILAALFSYLLGIYIAKLISEKLGWKIENFENLKKRLKTIWDRNKLKIALAVLFIISFAFTLFEFVKLGSVPILAGEIDKARFDVSTSGKIHHIALTLINIAILASVYIFYTKKIFTKKNIFFLILIILSFGILGLYASRAYLATPFVTILIAYHYLKKHLTVKMLGIILAIFFILVIAFIPYIRESSTYTYNWLYERSQMKIPESFASLTSGYLTITMNFETFQRLINYENVKVLWGQATLTPFITLIPGVKDPELVNWLELGPFITATYLAHFYVDFRIVGIIMGSLAIGLIASLVYRKMLFKPTLFNITVYSYFVYNIIFMIFSNNFARTPFYWDIVIFALVSFYARKNLLANTRS